MNRLLLPFALLIALTCSAAAQPRLPGDFVYLRDIDPGIAQDMRYASHNNFVGHPLPGYDAPECVVRREAADALKRVQADLAPSGLSLKVYDCYRPARAVRAMAQWSNDGRGDGPTKRFFPTFRKDVLFQSGWIAAYSAHSSGVAVDLTIVPRSRAAAPFDSNTRYGACTAPDAQRAPDNSLDMGTGFDCFDLRSYTRSAAISGDQKRSRGILLAAMSRHGFKNYFREWWHFYLKMPRLEYLDFPIPPRRH